MPILPKPSGCDNCALQKQGLSFTHPEGTGSSGIYIIGESAGENEAWDNLPFRPYGQAGSMLAQCLRQAKIERESLRIYNVVQCQPPKDSLDLRHRYSYDAIRQCVTTHLIPDIRRATPKVIVAMGAVPTRELTGLTGNKLGVSYIRGYFFDSYLSIPVIPTFHPSYLRQGNTSLIGVVVTDLRKALAFAQGDYVRSDPHTSYHEIKTIDE